MDVYDTTNSVTEDGYSNCDEIITRKRYRVARTFMTVN